MSTIPEDRWERAFGKRRAMQATGEVVGSMTVRKGEQGGARVFVPAAASVAPLEGSGSTIGPHGPLPDPERLTVPSTAHDHRHGITEMVGHLKEHGRYAPEQRRAIAERLAERKDLRTSGAKPDEINGRAPVGDLATTKE